jgi:hypothetical protein
MKRPLALAALLALMAAPSFAADAGWPEFWRAFAAAAGKDDQATLASLVKLDPSVVGSFAEVHKHYLKPSQRRCLAKARPVRDVDQLGQVNYGAFCGQLIYVFTNTPAGWRLTDLSPND